MLKSVPISVPLGGGLQHSQHEWKVRPPAALEVHNAHLRDGQSITKRNPSSRVTSIVSGQASQVLVPQDRALALYNEAGAHAVRLDSEIPSVVTQGFGGHIPTEVLSHPVLAFRGAVSGAQIAVNGDYIGVAVQEADYYDARSGVGGDVARSVVVLVLNRDFEIVAGPQRYTGTAPRIEPLGTGFAAFFLPTLALGATPNLHLKCAKWTPTGGFSASFTVSEEFVSVAQNRSNTDVAILYDTCPGPSDHSAVYITYRLSKFSDDQPPTQGFALYVHRLGADGSSLAVQLETPGVAGMTPQYNDAVWFSEDYDTVVVYNGHGHALHTTDGDLFLEPWVLNLSLGPVYVPARETPVFYRSGSSTLLNEVPIIFSGDERRRVSTGSTGVWTPVLHRRPQPRGLLGAYYFRDYTERQLDSDLMVKGPACVFTAEVYIDPVGGTTDGRIVAPITQDRLPIWRMTYFHGQDGGDDPDLQPKGVVGQTAVLDGSILLANLVANAAYLPPPLQREDDLSVGDSPNFEGQSPTWGRGAVLGAIGGAGVFEGTEQLVITEIKTQTPNYSYVDYYGSTLTAAGALSMFDGQTNVPAILETPREVTLWPEPSPAVDGGTAEYIPEEHQMFLADGSAVDFKGVFVFIDRNGIKYRSAPFDIGKIVNESGANQYYAPVIDFKLSESLSAIALDGRKLSLELYTNQIYPATDPPGEAFHLLFRGPVYWDGTTYTTDASSMYAPSRTLGPTDAWNFNPTPIYTDSGELVPVTPPASNVLAQAGNYIFLLSSEDPYDIRFSKPLDDRIGPEFNPLLSLEAPPESGGVVSLSGESDRLLLLCKTGVWELFVAGGGPDSQGEGAFPPFRKVWGGEGCITHRGTVSGMFGTFFVADSGPKIVGRDGSVTDISRDLGIEDFSELIRAVYVSADQEIWMFLGSSTYIFDLVTGQWTSSSTLALAAVAKDRRLFHLASNLDLYQQTGSPGGEQILAKYVSPWLSFDGPMGLKRVRRIGALVRIMSGSIGKLRVSVAYDYIDTEVDSAEWASSELGSLVKPVQLLVRPSRQKADSYRITVEEVGEDPPQGDPVSDLRWSLVDISLEVAAKGGLIKLQTEAKK